MKDDRKSFILGVVFLGTLAVGSALMLMLNSEERKSVMQEYGNGVLSYTEESEELVESESAREGDLSNEFEEHERVDFDETSTIPSYEVPQTIEYQPEDYAVPESPSMESYNRVNDGTNIQDTESITRTFDQTILSLCYSVFGNDVNLALSDTYSIIQEIGFQYPIAYSCDEQSHEIENGVELNILLPDYRAKAIVTFEDGLYRTTFRIMEQGEYEEDVE